MRIRVACLAMLAAALSSCVRAPVSAPQPNRARIGIENALRKHIDVLASEAFGGRRAGTDGEAQTLRYLAREWQAAGLESGTNDPANPWFAPVALALSTPSRSALAFQRNGRAVPLPAGEAMVFSAGTRALLNRAPVVFVGQAGERLEAAAVTGRVALMLWDHPGQAEQRDALLRAGAAAVIAVVRDREEFDALVAFRKRGAYRLASGDGGEAVDGYITRAAAAALLGAERFDALVQGAAEADFRPVPLDLSATLEATAAAGTVRTFNLIGRLPGRVPNAGAVLVLAHWDHFGTCGSPPAAPAPCRGAVDNASGLALQAELAKRLGAGPRPDRDVYFLATTAEEWGLLGAQAFAENPPIPLDTIVAAFNLDMVAVAPAGSPVSIIGKGLTPLDPGILQVLRANGRTESDEGRAEQYLRRQDGWALIQRDVPAVSVTSAFGDPAALDRFLATRYHQPADTPAGIELGGAADDLVLTQALVAWFANTKNWTGTAGKSVTDP